MCDRLIHFHRKTKASWRRLGPFRIGLSRVRAGKRRVDFRTVQHSGIAGQVTSGNREFFSRRPRQGSASGADDDHLVIRAITSTNQTPVTASILFPSRSRSVSAASKCASCRRWARSVMTTNNAMAESFFNTLEKELLDRRRFKSQTEAPTAIFAWIEG